MPSIEVEAKTVAEAVSLACQQLQTTEDRLGIEVLEQGHGKIFALFSGKKAKIRATLKAGGADSPGPTPSGTGSKKLGMLKEHFEKIIKEIDGSAHVTIAESDDEVVFNIVGDGSGIFIGKKGQTLEALQYLINKIRLKQSPDAPHISVDSEGYRTRHVESLENLARRLSEKARRKGGPVTTNPLNAADRRVIHMALKKDPDLTTWSKGEGGMRRVIIAPRQ